MVYFGYDIPKESELSKEQLKDLEKSDMAKLTKIAIALADENRGKFHESFYITQVGLSYLAYLLIQHNNKDSKPSNDTIDTICQDKEIAQYLKKLITEGYNFSSLLSAQPEELIGLILLDMENEQKYPKFYPTPEGLTKLAIRLLQITETDDYADFCSGIGSSMITAVKESSPKSCTIYEINNESNIIASIRSKFLGDTISVKSENVFSLSKKDVFDKIFSNYPLGLRLNEQFKETALYSEIKNRFGEFPKATSTDWYFNYALVTHLKTNGKAVGIMTNAGTWNTLDRDIREKFLASKYIEAIIALPDKLFPYTGIGVSMIILSENNEKVRFIDCKHLGQNKRRINILADRDIDTIVEMYHSNSEHSKVVSLADIKKEEFNLNPSRYLEGDIVNSKDAVEFGSIIKSITRGAHYNASELDEISSNIPTSIQYLMLSNIKNGLIDDDLPFVKEDIANKYNKYLIQDNNILLSKNGYPFKVALATVPKNKKIIANGNLFVIELDETRANPYYIKAFLESDVGIKSLKSISVGMAIPNIAINGLMKLKIPLVPLKEQEKFAAEYQTTLDEIALYKRKIEKSVNALLSSFKEHTIESATT
ncbi:N-6 DNA methylase [Treponema primitia]|uniref:N-6 DNA methylase n=1 Tax=Treponema primitia TaxID=88058 RepID=UPI0039807F19